MATSFAEFFNFENNYAERQDFLLRPEKDARLFFGRDALKQHIYHQIKQPLDQGTVPKLLLHGSYGIGKTHTLHHIKDWIDRNYPAQLRCYFIGLDGLLGSKSSYADFHFELFRKIGHEEVARIVDHFVEHQGGEKAIRELTQGNEELTRAFVLCRRRKNTQKSLLQEEESAFVEWTPESNIAWKWLLGMSLLAAERNATGFTLHLFENKYAVDLPMLALFSLGKMLHTAFSQKMLLLIDEIEALQRTESQPRASFNTPFRRLADVDNQSIGFLLTSFLPEISGSFLGREDFKNRMDDKQRIDLDNFGSNSAPQLFLEELLKELLRPGFFRKNPHYPFSDDAFEVFFDIIEKQAKIKELTVTPRLVLRLFNGLAYHAFSSKNKPPLNASIVYNYLENQGNSTAS